MDSREAAPTFADQQVDLFKKRKSGNRLAYSLIASVLIAAIAALHVALWQVLGWLALQAVACFLGTWRSDAWARAQLRVVTALTSAADLTTLQLRMGVLRFLMLGLGGTLSLTFFASLPLLERVCYSFLMASIYVGFAWHSLGHRPMMCASWFPTLLPLGVLWMIVPVPETASTLQPEAVGIGIEALLLLIFFSNHSGVMVLRDILQESFTMRSERAELVKALRAALAQAEAANRAKTRFLAAASHDLRLPIQAVGLFAAALEMRPLDPRSQQLARSINHALQDVSAELDALLDISKLDAGTIQPELTEVALQPLLQRLREVFTAPASAKGLELLLECPGDAWVRTDRNLLERIVRNLLDNAIKYTDVGRITMSVATQASSYRLSIADTGCGIDATEQERVFEEFYQIANAMRERSCGLGLGLSIIRRLTQLLGLPLQLQSNPGRGTVVSLDLPPSCSPCRSSSIRTEPPARKLAGVRVLVVDDEAAVRESLAALLEEMGCKVAVAHDTAGALVALESEPQDLLITDFRLPCTGGGLAVIAAARASQPALPAVLITGDTAPDRLREARAAGVDILHKPVGADLLRQLIAHLPNTVGDRRPSQLGRAAASSLQLTAPRATRGHFSQ
jgi:signal transduction histidine kinase/FixJ family two-component response regulator